MFFLIGRTGAYLRSSVVRWRMRRDSSSLAWFDRAGKRLSIFAGLGDLGRVIVSPERKFAARIAAGYVGIPLLRPPLTVLATCSSTHPPGYRNAVLPSYRQCTSVASQESSRRAFIGLLGSTVANVVSESEFFSKFFSLDTRVGTARTSPCRNLL